MNNCIKCFIKIDNNAKLCRKCYNQLRRKNAITLKKYYCENCGTNIFFTTFLYGSKKCSSCSKLGKRNPMFGKINEQNGNWKGGLYSKEYYCTDCGKKIGIWSGLYHSGLCKSCAYKAEKNPMWQGGLNKHGYYLFTPTLKEKIRDRDKHICQNPNCNYTEKENFRALDIHHIDYNRKNCNEENLISLCQQCNLKANANRDYWFAFYTYIIKEKLDECFNNL